MAYNGNSGDIFRKIEEATSNMATTDSDQEIDGNKEFLKPIKTSGIYDSIAKRNFVHPAITHIEGDVEKGILVSNADGTAATFGSLSFNGESLKAPSYFGSAIGLTNLQATQLVGKISVDNIGLGEGFGTTNNRLKINLGPGLEFRDNSISFKYGPGTGLGVDDNGLYLSADATQKKRHVGSDDRILVSDSNDNNDLKHVTVDTLSRYFSNTLPFRKPAGTNGQLQVNEHGQFGSSPNLLFQGDTLSTLNLSVNGTLQIGKNLIKKDRFMIHLPSDAVDNSTIPNNAFTLFLDEEQNKLMLRVKYSTGIVRNVSIDLLKKALVQEEDDERENEGFLFDDDQNDNEIGIDDEGAAEDFAALEKKEETTGGILGYFKSAFTKK